MAYGCRSVLGAKRSECHQEKGVLLERLVARLCPPLDPHRACLLTNVGVQLVLALEALRLSRR